MRTIGFALFAVASVAVSGCGSMDTLSIGDLHIGSAAPVKSDDTPALLPAQTENTLYLGVVDGLEKQQRFAAALAFLDQYAVQEKELPLRYWLLRGNALAGTGKYEDAAAAFDKLDNTSLAAQGWDGKGRASAAGGHWAEASYGFQNAVLADPSNSEYLNNLAYAQMHLGRAAEAEGNLRQAYELAPQSPLIRNNLAIALSMQGKAADAAAVLNTIKSEPERQQVTALAQKLGQFKTLEEKS